MPIVDVDVLPITDWDSFHDTFAVALGFPDFYGRNMNAWVDCLTYEDDGMTAFPMNPETSSRSNSTVPTSSEGDARRSSKR
jgi:RNAse (barnase) inhibitor barstar